MMPTLLVLAFACFALATFGRPKKAPGISVLALGLALFIASLLFPDAGNLPIR